LTAVAPVRPLPPHVEDEKRAHSETTTMTRKVRCYSAVLVGVVAAAGYDWPRGNAIGSAPKATKTLLEGPSFADGARGWLANAYMCRLRDDLNMLHQFELPHGPGTNLGWKTCRWADIFGLVKTFGVIIRAGETTASFDGKKLRIVCFEPDGEDDCYWVPTTAFMPSKPMRL